MKHIKVTSSRFQVVKSIESPMYVCVCSRDWGLWVRSCGSAGMPIQLLGLQHYVLRKPYLRWRCSRTLKSNPAAWLPLLSVSVSVIGTFKMLS